MPPSPDGVPLQRPEAWFPYGFAAPFPAGGTGLAGSTPSEEGKGSPEPFSEPLASLAPPPSGFGDATAIEPVDSQGVPTLSTAFPLAGRFAGAWPAMQIEDDQGNTRSSDDGLNVLPQRSNFAESTLSAPVELATSYFMGPPSPQEMVNLTKIPWTRAYSYNGSLEAGQASIAFRIPVGPNTRTLTIDVHADRDGQPFTPKIDQLYLVSPRGDTLAAISGVMAMANGDGQTLYIKLHGAPKGGELVLRVVRTLVEAQNPGDQDGGDSQGSTPIDGQGPLGSWGDASFEMSILRDDSMPRSSAALVASPVGGTFVAFLPVATPTDSPDATAAYAPNWAPWNPEGVSAPRVADGARQDKAASDFDSLEDEATTVFLGPLVSRTAAPLGPVLATIAGDPTPSTDRASRPQADPLNVLAGDLELDLILNLKLRSAARGRADGPGGSSEEGGPGRGLEQLQGAEGVPILLSGVRPRDAREEADALAENLRRQAEAGELLAQASGPGPSIDDPRSGAEVARAGLATRAMGFLIGLGIASGPLYPDLVSLARRKFLRRARTGRRKGEPRG